MSDYSFDKCIDRQNTGSIKWEIAPKCVIESGNIPLSIADMELETAPEIIQAMKAAATHGICGYTGVDDAYFEALRGFQERRHDFPIEREWLTVTSGVVTALGIAVRAFSKKGDGVLINTPAYPPFFSAVKGNERTLIESELLLKSGRYEMNFNEMEALAKNAKLLILCSPHNPVGRVWTASELERLADICIKNDLIVIADEIHQDIVLENNKHITFANIKGMKERCIVCTSMSKTFNLAGLSCSDVFIANKELREHFKNVQQRDSTTCVPYFARAAQISAHTKCDKWLDELLAYLSENFRFMYDYFSANMPNITCARTEGTYLAWVDMRALKMDCNQLEAFSVNKALLALDEGYIFGKAGEGFERWNLALPREELKKCLDRLYSAYKQL